MANKKISKASKRRLMTFGTISFLIIGYFFMSLVTYTIEIGKLSNEQRQLQSELKGLQHDEQNLKIEIQKLKDPEYVARYARENYLYSKDGEYIIKLEPNDQVKTEKNTQFNDWNKNIIFVVGGLLIIFVIYLIRKRKTTK